jgi:hypothetical protein
MLQRRSIKSKARAVSSGSKHKALSSNPSITKKKKRKARESMKGMNLAPEEVISWLGNNFFTRFKDG